MRRLSDHHSPLKIFIIVWMLFFTLYFLRSGYEQLQSYFAQRAYNNGAASAIGRLITEAEKCKAIPINAGATQTALISVDCLNQDDAAENEDAMEAANEE